MALLRDLLRQSASSLSERGEACLKRLADLSADPEERGRYLLERCRHGARDNEIASALDAARELAALDAAAGIAMADDPSLRVAPDGLAASLVKRLSGAAAPVIREFERRVLSDLAAALAARNVNLARRLIRICNDSGAAHEARLKLARLLVDERRFQEAETL